VLSENNDSMDKFLAQGLEELGPKLGPINWQFMATKKFDPVDFEGFLKLLPREIGGPAGPPRPGGPQPDLRHPAVLRPGREVRRGHRLRR
jgi:uncharacterized protein YecE (DUF72 family)